MTTRGLLLLIGLAFACTRQADPEALRGDRLDDGGRPGIPGLRALAVRTGDIRRVSSVPRGLVFMGIALTLSTACRHGTETPVGEVPERHVAPAASAAEAVVPPELVDTSWQLVRIDGRELDPDLTEVTLMFEASRAVGSGGCNWYTAWLEQADGGLMVSHLAVTRRSCLHPRIMESEARYLAALEGLENYRLEGDELVLTAGAAESLEFRRE